ncbi:E3 ubiquitin-protein ligase MYLIP-B-like [Anneissia japonica]|uniref:E3 ubiquitin-protein ligase MYLIP-B-like n=1 Tax=Anneissia japonica TaxID=1529436 RepID=UPI001425996B|nr:E3 ubiquitin-protein ligase MYLIP-B-like [Anneissia japonica]
MWCFVSESPAVIREYRVPKNAPGQYLFDKVCDDLGIIEKDYFGLRFRGKKSELLWLNLRNPLRLQLRGKSPHRFSLQVKFFVSPQELQQPMTRHVYYLTLKNRLLLGHYVVHDQEKLDLFALIAQAELGCAQHVVPTQYHTVFPALFETKLSELENAHRRLDMYMTKSYAEIKFINKISKLTGYGVEYFTAESFDKKDIVIGVCCTGLQVLSKERQLKHNIKFEDISRVSYHQNQFTVHYYRPHEETNGEDVLAWLKYRLPTRRSAQALFRSFTESHTFFRCDTVERVVRQQHSHIGFGSLLVLVKPDTRCGKIFRFDVSRTRRQVHDSAWRLLHPGDGQDVPQIAEPAESIEVDSHFTSGTMRSTHSQEIMLSRQPSRRNGVHIQTLKSHHEVKGDSSDDSTPENTLKSKACKRDSSHGKQDGPSTDANIIATLQEKINQIHEARLCQVCLDQNFNTVFCPCGHMTCCDTCAQECQKCPMCRAEVAYVQRVFVTS